jgi:hypothetical protein
MKTVAQDGKVDASMTINLKLSFKNNELQQGTIDLRGQDTIVIGGHGTHPTAHVSLQYTPSIDGVIGSIISKCNYFPGRPRLHLSRQKPESE